jgi:hypothetical protein
MTLVARAHQQPTRTSQEIGDDMRRMWRDQREVASFEYPNFEPPVPNPNVRVLSGNRPALHSATRATPFTVDRTLTFSTDGRTISSAYDVFVDYTNRHPYNLEVVLILCDDPNLSRHWDQEDPDEQRWSLLKALHSVRVDINLRYSRYQRRSEGELEQEEKEVMDHINGVHTFLTAVINTEERPNETGAWTQGFTDIMMLFDLFHELPQLQELNNPWV